VLADSLQKQEESRVAGAASSRVIRGRGADYAQSCSCLWPMPIIRSITVSNTADTTKVR
jgi:hypothetical protein